MPVKIAPKPAIKSSIASKVAAKSPADKEKADRQAVVASIVSDIAETITTAREAEKASQSAFFDIADTATRLIEEKGLSVEEGSLALKLSFAESYGVDVENLTMEGSPMAYNYLSKIKRLVFPVSPKQAKQLKAARAKGVTVADALKIARTEGLLASQVKASAGKGKKANADGTVSKASGAIEDEEALGNALSAVISKAVKGSMDLETIGEVFAASLAEYEAAAEGEPSEE